MDLKNQMMFPDEMNDEFDDQHQEEEKDMLGRRQFNEEEDEDEEDLQAEEADQVFDDFGAPSGSVSHNAVAKTQNAVTLGMVDEDEGSANGDEQANDAQADRNPGGAEEEEEDFSLKFPKEYHSKTLQNQKVTEQYVGHDGKIQRIY